MSDDPFDLLAAERPTSSAPDDLQTARARRALLHHIASERSGLAGSDPRVGPGRIPRRAVLWAAVAGVLIALGGLGAIVVGGTPEADTTIDVATIPDDDDLGAPVDVVALVERVGARARPEGNATVVERTHGVGTVERRGVDLYADDGGYAYDTTTDGAMARLDGTPRVWPVPEPLPAALASLVSGPVRADAEDPASTVLAAVTGRAGPTDPALVVDQAWALGLAAAPLAAGSPDVAAGTIVLFDALPDVELVEAPDDRVVAVRTTDRGSERIFFEARSGVAVRYERRDASGRLVAGIDYRIDRVELGG